MRSAILLTLAVGASANWLDDLKNVADCVAKCPKVPDWTGLFPTPEKVCAAACTGWPTMDEIIGDVKEWTVDEWDAVSAEKVDEFIEAANKKGAGFWKTTVEGLSWEKAATWSKKQWDEVPIEDIVALGWQKLQQVPWEEFGRMTQEQIRSIPVDDLVKLLGVEIAKLDADTLAKFADKYWDKVPVAQLTEFTAETFKKICTAVDGSKELEAKCPSWVAEMDPDQIASMTGDAWTAIPVSTFLGFSIEQLQAIDYDALAGWTKEQWDSLPAEQLLRFTGEQVSAIPAEVVASWSADMWKSVKVDQLIQLTGEQLNSIPYEQLVTELAKLTDAQIQKLSADTLAKLRADPGTSSTLNKLAEVKDKTDALLAKIKEHNDAKKNTVTLKMVLSKTEADPGASASVIESAKQAVTLAATKEADAAVSVDTAKTDAGLPTNEEENAASNEGIRLGFSTAALLTLAVMVR